MAERIRNADQLDYQVPAILGTCQPRPLAATLPPHFLKLRAESSENRHNFPFFI
jgi:hypothetical protein